MPSRANRRVKERTILVTNLSARIRAVNLSLHPLGGGVVLVTGPAGGLPSALLSPAGSWPTAPV